MLNILWQSVISKPITANHDYCELNHNQNDHSTNSMGNKDVCKPGMNQWPGCDVCTLPAYFLLYIYSISDRILLELWNPSIYKGYFDLLYSEVFLLVLLSL